MKFKQNNILYLLFALVSVLSILFNSCERDDICDTANVPITPRLIITFQDFADNNLRKNATGIEVSLTEDSERIVPGIERFDSIVIPLDINNDNVQYEFKINANSTDPTIIRTDTLELSYKRTNEFVSKACGFRTVFSELSINNTTDTEMFDDSSNWIRNILIENSTVNEETNAQVRIFH